jgi:hypothetical protein
MNKTRSHDAASSRRPGAVLNETDERAERHFLSTSVATDDPVSQIVFSFYDDLVRRYRSASTTRRLSRAATNRPSIAAPASS